MTCRFTTPSLGLALVLACAAPSMAAEDVVIVYDASGSMWGQIDGVSKIEIARDVMADLITGWDADTNLGLIAYGHRRQGDCADIETLISPGPVDRDAFITTVNAIRPNGKTPLTSAVQQAAELLSWRDNPATVVLISDGLETCNADPCALSADLARQGVDFTAHVVGFDLEDAAHASLSCIAENTGGMFVPASNAEDLQLALAKVKTAVNQPAATADPEPEPEPEPAPEPELPSVSLRGPEQVTTGAQFDFHWSGSIHPRDYITIVPAGADEGSHTSYVRVSSDSKGSLTAPSAPGLYELRYVLSEGSRTLASVGFEAVEAEVSLTGPEQVTTGAQFDFHWSGSIHPRDYITIVPAGADEGSHTSYVRVASNTEGSLTAPSTPGLYELRYVLSEGSRTLASVSFEAVEAEVSLTGPDQVTTGAQFDFHWSDSIHPRDYITIVPAGADEGSHTSYVRVSSDSKGSLTAPSAPGLYELRYVLAEGSRTLASVNFEAVEAEVSLTGPEQVTTGAQFDFHWSGSIHPRDYITIVPAGADEGSHTSYVRVSSDSKGSLTAPSAPGLYELRYVLAEGSRTLASVNFEAVEAEVGIRAPTVQRAGENVDISWSATIHPRDYITIVPLGTDDDSHGPYNRTGNATEARMKAPDEPGLYEVRYILSEGHRVLARAPLEVVDANAPLDDGAGLSAPATASPGEVITVTWTGGRGDGNPRIALARKDQPDFSWLAAFPAGETGMIEVPMPDAAGFYEIRFLDIAGPALLGRTVVEVK